MVLFQWLVVRYYFPASENDGNKNQFECIVCYLGVYRWCHVMSAIIVVLIT